MVPVRRRAIVGLDERGVDLRDVVPGCRDEGVFVHSVLDSLCPRAERVAERREVFLHVVERAEVDERKAPRCATLDLLERALPRLQVELGRLARREDDAAGRDVDADDW